MPFSLRIAVAALLSWVFAAGLAGSRAAAAQTYGRGGSDRVRPADDDRSRRRRVLGSGGHPGARCRGNGHRMDQFDAARIARNARGHRSAGTRNARRRGDSGQRRLRRTEIRHAAAGRRRAPLAVASGARSTWTRSPASSGRRTAATGTRFTQFEAIYARRAFPCFDEPRFQDAVAAHAARPEEHVARLEHAGRLARRDASRTARRRVRRSPDEAAAELPGRVRASGRSTSSTPARPAGTRRRSA